MREPYAHCVCPPSRLRAPVDICGRKNYRLQDIQLSKITGASAFGLRAGSLRGNPSLGISNGGPRDYFPRTPFAHSLVGPRCPTPFVRENSGAPARRSPRDLVPKRMNFSKTSAAFRGRFRRAGVSRAPASQRPLNGVAVNRVENTGLEPVTSWLQTRRSPS